LGIDCEEAYEMAQTGFIPELERNPHQHRPVNEPVFDQDKTAAMDILVPGLLKQQIIEEIADPPDSDFGTSWDPVMQFKGGIPFPVPRTVYTYSHVVFPVPKEGKAGRAVTGAKLYNDNVKPRKFKMEGVHTLRGIVQPCDYCCSADISDFYPAIPCHERYKKHYCFRWRGQWYAYRGVVFGVSSAPRAASKLIRPLLGLLRASYPGLRVICFLDDFLILHQDPNICAEHMQILLDWLVKLGFIVHPRKCILIPTQIMPWLGLIVDTVRLRLRLPRKRRRGIQRMAKSLLTADRDGLVISLRTVGSLLGKCRAASQCVMCIILQTRNLLRLKHKVMRGGKKTMQSGCLRPDWEQPVGRLNDDERRDLVWIVEFLHLWNGKEILPLFPQVEVATDAAKTIGGGLVLLPFVGADQQLATHECRWLWLPYELHLNINIKELWSLELGFRSLDLLLPDLLYDVRVLVNSDNMAAISYTNKMGGPYTHLSLLAEALWRWCLRRGIVVFCRHLRGILNTMADKASRDRGNRSDWKLFATVFSSIEERFGPHSVDLMASRANRQLPRYFSQYGDPDAAGHDALQQNWRSEANCFCHPPFIMLPHVLRKVVEEGVTITLVAPVWPTQAWLSVLMELSIAPPLLLNRELVHPVLPTKWEVTQPKWRTAAWRICGQRSQSVVFSPQQWTAFFRSGVLPV
jgi:hypothetical protein